MPPTKPSKKQISKKFIFHEKPTTSFDLFKTNVFYHVRSKKNISVGDLVHHTEDKLFSPEPTYTHAVISIYANLSQSWVYIGLKRIKSKETTFVFINQ
jgi:hypothetical protein